MNELLTKGIGHTEFKESELGRIPKSWELRECLFIRDGTHGPIFITTEFLFFMQNIRSEKLFVKR